MKGKILLTAILTTAFLNAHASEVKLLKHTEQPALHTKLTLTNLKNDADAMLRLKSYAELSVKPEKFIYAKSEIDSIKFVPESNITEVKGNTLFMIWNSSPVAHLYSVERIICIYDSNEKKLPRGNCSHINDLLHIDADETFFLNSEIESSQLLKHNKPYEVVVSITVQNENNTDLFVTNALQDMVAQ